MSSTVSMCIRSVRFSVRAVLPLRGRPSPEPVRMLQLRESGEGVHSSLQRTITVRTSCPPHLPGTYPTMSCHGPLASDCSLFVVLSSAWLASHITWSLLRCHLHLWPHSLMEYPCPQSLFCFIFLSGTYIGVLLNISYLADWHLEGWVSWAHLFHTVSPEPRRASPESTQQVLLKCLLCLHLWISSCTPPHPALPPLAC